MDSSGLASQKFIQKPAAAATVASRTTLPDVSEIVSADLGNSGKVQSLVSLFGEARVSWKSSRDPLMVRLPGHPANEQMILTVQGGDGLAAIVATYEAVPSLLRRRPQLRKTLRSLWESGFIFWVRGNFPVANSGSLALNGAELVQSGLIPLEFDSHTMRALVDNPGPILTFDLSDLWIESGSEPTVAPSPSVHTANGPLAGDGTVAAEAGSGDVQIPAVVASGIRKLFGPNGYGGRCLGEKQDANMQK